MSCTIWHVQNTVNTGMRYVLTGAGFTSMNSILSIIWVRVSKSDAGSKNHQDDITLGMKWPSD